MTNVDGTWVTCAFCGEKFRYVIWNGTEPPPEICMSCDSPIEKMKRKKK